MKTGQNLFPVFLKDTEDPKDERVANSESIIQILSENGTLANRKKPNQLRLFK
jgi:hypothetical protein